VLRAIFGAVEQEAGTISLDGVEIEKSLPTESIRRGIAYLPPDRKLLGGFLDKSARENFSLLDLKPFWRGWRLCRKPEAQETAGWFSRFSVRPADAIERPLSTFSGGNQQKILFAKWLRIEPLVLLLDEPTQGVDVGAKAALHKQLLQAAKDGATVVVSSTDVEELAAICKRVVVMRNGRIAADLTGSALTQSALTRACVGTE
jgi:ribose transport system ATP-binding protein